MRKLVTTIIILMTVQGLNAQITISGTVKSTRGTILPGVSITLKGTYDGCISDSAGKYSFNTFEKGNFNLEAKILGYTSTTQNIKINKEALQINFSLKEEVTELKAVSVTAGSFEAGDKKRAATVLSTLDIYTTGGANADITTAIKTLPGAQQVGEQEGLFIRGGAGYETKQMIDGLVVNNPFYSSTPGIASRGRFSPSLFKGNIFSTGGYSALYGQALSSVLLLESIDLPDHSEATASISSIFLGAGTEQLAKNKKSSWGVNYGYANLLPYFAVVKQKPDYFTNPESYTADANFRIKTKKGGMIKYYTTFSANHLGLRRPDIDSSLLKDAFGLKNTNWYNNLTWKEYLNKGWKMNLGLSYSTNNDHFNQQVQNVQDIPQTTGISYIDAKIFTSYNRQDISQVRAVFEKRLKGISALRFGGEYWYGYQKTIYNGNAALLEDHYKALFGEADLYIINGLAAKLGARIEHSSIINKANIAPRLSLAYRTGKNAQMSLAFGTFYQNPENAQLLITTNLGYTKATHYIANYIKTTNNYIFRVEAFYKKYEYLVKTAPTYNNNGKGYAQGIELFWRDKKTFKGLDYWISYSYLDTKRDYLNYPEQLQPDFATHHTFNLVTKKFITKWKTGFNLTYTYATGRPYYNLQYNSNNSKYDIADKGITKDYHNLGFSLNYLPNLGKKNTKAFIVWVASVTNVFNFNQVYGYNYSYNGLSKTAITPPANQFFFIGCFLSWGVDRSQDAINNNL